MIARVVRFQVAQDKLDKNIQTFRESVVPAAKLQKGYRSGYLLVDRKTGNCISIAFWDREEDAIADEKSGQYQKRVDLGKKYYAATPVRELYELAFQDYGMSLKDFEYYYGNQ